MEDIKFGIPSETDAEQSLMSALLCTSEALGTLQKMGIQPCMFTNPKVNRLYGMMISLRSKLGRVPEFSDVAREISRTHDYTISREDIENAITHNTGYENVNICAGYVRDAYYKTKLIRDYDHYLNILKDPARTVDECTAWLKAQINNIIPAGQDDVASEIGKWIYDTSEDQNLPDYVFTMRGTKTMPLGSITAVTGKAKAGKSNFIMWLMAAMLSPGQNILGISTDKQLSILYIDTEQPKHAINLKFRRMLRTIRHDEHQRLATMKVHLLSMRDATIQQRRGMLGKAVQFFSPKMVIIDGIVDLIEDFNDISQSQQLITELMEITSKGISIIALLHQNESNDNMRGHLGTFLFQKCDDKFEVSKDKTKKCFCVKSTSRNYNISEMHFSIHNGIYISTDEAPF